MKIVKQLFKFGIVGFINNIIFLSVYYIVVFINARLYIAGNILGFLISVLSAYFMNSRYVFENNDNSNSPKQIVKTYILYGVSLILSTVILIISVENFHISEKIAPFISLTITVPINFLANKIWIYKDYESKEK